MSEPPQAAATPEGEAVQPGFSRSGFAPIPHRHSEIASLPLNPSAPSLSPRLDGDRDERDRVRGREREMPRRDLDPEPEDRGRVRAWDEFPPGRGSRGQWEDDFTDRPKRRRSPSPLGPPSHRPRLGSPSPPRYSLPDPASIETLLLFREFAQWFRGSHPQTARADEEETKRHREMIESGEATGEQAKEKVGMARRYERYRKEFTSRQLYALFLTHRDSAWFKEKYSHLPAQVALRRRVDRQGRIPQVTAYITQLRSGVQDDVNFDEAEDATPAKDEQKMDTDEPEGLSRALGEKGDRDRTGDRHEWGDENVKIELAPRTKQIFVKTVPPSCSRKSLEDLFKKIPGFQWLALGEPAAKRSFFRVAWAQYAEDTDVSEAINELEGSKIDGFTFHMNINASPTIGRVRIAPPATNSLQRLVTDGEKAKLLALSLENELLGDDEDVEETEDDKKDEENSEAKKETDAEAPNKEIVEKTEKAEQEIKIPGLEEKGSDVVEEAISRILISKGLDVEELNEEQKLQKAKITLDQWIAYLRNALSTCYYCVAPCSFAEELHRKCIHHVRAHPSAVQTAQVEDDHHEGTAQKDEKEEKEEPVPVPAEEGSGELEREGDEDREMRDGGDSTSISAMGAPANAHATNGNQKSPEKRGRRNLFPQKTAEEKWIDGHDFKIAPLISEVDIADYGGRDPEEETKKVCAPLIKQEETNKYRCKECSKLFRAPEFVLKHITSKHPEVAQSKIDDASYLNNFVLDPQHLQPSNTTLAAIDDKLPSASAALALASGGASLPPFAGGLPNGPGAFNPQMAGHGQFGLMQQQMMMMFQMQHAMMLGQMGMGSNGTPGGAPGTGQTQPGGPQTPSRQGAPGQLAQRMGGYSASPATLAPLPPPPPGGEDPRARRGRVSYQDLDEPGSGGGGGLPY